MVCGARRRRWVGRLGGCPPRRRRTRPRPTPSRRDRGAGSSSRPTSPGARTVRRGLAERAVALLRIGERSSSRRRRHRVPRPPEECRGARGRSGPRLKIVAWPARASGPVAEKAASASTSPTATATPPHARRADRPDRRAPVRRAPSASASTMPAQRTSSPPRRRRRLRRVGGRVATRWRAGRRCRVAGPARRPPRAHPAAGRSPWRGPASSPAPIDAAAIGAAGGPCQSASTNTTASAAPGRQADARPRPRASSTSDGGRGGRTGRVADATPARVGRYLNREAGRKRVQKPSDAGRVASQRFLRGSRRILSDVILTGAVATRGFRGGENAPNHAEIGHRRGSAERRGSVVATATRAPARLRRRVPTRSAIADGRARAAGRRSRVRKPGQEKPLSSRVISKD